MKLKSVSSPNQKSKLESLSDLLQSQLNVEKFSIVETEKQSGLEQLLELKMIGVASKTCNRA